MAVFFDDSRDPQKTSDGISKHFNSWLLKKIAESWPRKRPVAQPSSSVADHGFLSFSWRGARHRNAGNSSASQWTHAPERRS
jgi:hypothetical protein